jgi:trk system potassium uptake protein TrkH
LRVPPRRRHVLVDVRASVNIVALMTTWLSLTLLAPAFVALWYGESLVPFLVPLPIGVAVGLGVERLTRGPTEIGLREGFLVVSLAWLVAAALGALPYIVEGGDIDRPIDAYFEAMSGFTTTGASVMSDISSHSRAILFWRSLTQWLGGMGIIVLALAILPRLSAGGRSLMENESPGPEFDKLAPRIKDTAKRLWLLYIGITAIGIALLCLVGYGGLSPGMDLYNAVCHTFTAMATGGFSPEPRSLEPFGAWAQWILILIMFAAGMNFALWYRGLFRTPRWFLRDEEFRLYVICIAVATATLTWMLYGNQFHDLEGSFRHATFQTVTIMTTTGYASTDYALWPGLGMFVLVVLMFIGGCAGSTGGAIKPVRFLIAGRALRREVETAAHPQHVKPIRVTGKTVEEEVVRAALAFIVLYILIFALGALVLLIDAQEHGLELSAVEAIVAAATTIGNVGPGFGFAGPYGSFAPFHDVSTLTMIVLMWIGRLELIPILVLLTRAYWRR